MERAYANHFGQATLEDLASSHGLQLAIVATDAVKQERIAFTADKVLRFPVSTIGHQDNITELTPIEAQGAHLSLAVAASSCFPPVFPRMILTHNDLGLTFAEFKETLSLNDGGVVDNLGIECLLALRKTTGSCGGMVVVSDAERPQRTKPRNSLATDAEAQAGCVKRRSKRARARSELGSDCVLVQLARRVPPPEGLPFRVQTLLSGFRTDLDAPSWQEANALLRHGASAAAATLPRLGSGNREKHMALIRAIIRAADGPGEIADPSEFCLKNCHRRPMGKVLL